MADTSMKAAQYTPRSIEISEEERQAARNAIKQFDSFLKVLWAAQQHNERLSDVLEKTPDASPERLFGVRHLLRQFQKKVRSDYTKAIPSFNEALKSLEPFGKDTETVKIKENLMDAMRELSEVVEAYLEIFEDFNAPDQVQRMIARSKRIEELSKSIQSVIEGQLKTHLQKDILQRTAARLERIRSGSLRRSRLIRMIGGSEW